MKKKNMIKTLVAGLIIAALAAGCAGSTGAAGDKEAKVQKDGVFIHISHGTDDPHRALMALQMAAVMSEDKDVLVYIDIKGVDIALKDSQDIAYSHFPTSREQIKKLLDRGVGVYVCPGCLKAAGKTGDDLMEGVKLADKNAFFNFTEGRILTLDY